MRRTSMSAQVRPDFFLPRGWILLGSALASWLLVAAMWSGVSQVFQLLSAV